MTPARGFLDLAQVMVPRSLAEFANDHLRAVGKDGYEGFALWAGVREGDLFVVSETLIPRQSGIRSEAGVCVAVDGKELFHINRFLYERGLSLVAQLHSHPGNAYHSDTDDALPIATTVGALSLVIPDFAIHPFSLDRCAIYRLLPREGWVELPPAAAARLIQIDNDS